ncbi:serine/threonine protein kinase [Desulfitobacterium dichloroeliminans LMG P-21439]|uniref:non-specific serine/threonine protein kinase n=1 Tax=Desulfitobacterium dichloroeliminans (strain LMG P-21439 / DCA1) TaxID=871963 RepID=L0FAV2_DESDL|nr:Stk1 family PASTA domain-containing Ser/Thr kinase [Desulfitobacterium dichloroeliminans]AGA70145.1 serine/threonine protein kinase [Desulfitobacterium dichloroeliminans LMG P-21439]
MSKIFSNRYEIIEKIGSGGMAIVYKAKDLLLNRIVTIKVLREQFTADEEFVRRFRREAQSAASLSHMNIVSIYDVGKDGESEYIVMEYVEGQNLKEIIRSYAPLSTEQTLDLGIQIAEAIHHAHEHHIIHRDIKPHNILVTDDGRIKVTDFGIARAVSAATMTHSGDIVGSVHYLSPEQAKGVQTNEQSDVYSLGIILYELLTGKVPYDGESPIAIALKHLQEQAVPPSKLNPRVSPAFENLVIRAIAKSPDQRYATAKELMQDLHKVQAGLPVDKVDSGDQDLDNTRIHRSLSNGVNSVLASEAAENDRKKIPRKPRKRWPWVALGILVLLVGGLWIGLSNWFNVDTTTVPPLVGKSINEAGYFVERANLFLDPETLEENSDTVEKGKITRSEPQEGSAVKEGKSIKIWMSLGPQQVKFPNFKTGDITHETAVNNLKSLGFVEENITIQTDQNSALPTGIIAEQDPAPGIDWPKNGYITLFVSAGKGSQPQPLPSVIGKSPAEAQAILIQYGLVVTPATEDSTEFPPDVVMDTIPKPGTMVKKGDSVKIIISRGPGPIAFNPVILASVANSR